MQKNKIVLIVVVVLAAGAAIAYFLFAGKSNSSTPALSDSQKQPGSGGAPPTAPPQSNLTAATSGNGSVSATQAVTGSAVLTPAPAVGLTLNYNGKPVTINWAGNVYGIDLPVGAIGCDQLGNCPSGIGSGKAGVVGGYYYNGQITVTGEALFTQIANAFAKGAQVKANKMGGQS